jgi:hypothetical protein
VFFTDRVRMLGALGLLYQRLGRRGAATDPWADLMRLVAWWDKTEVELASAYLHQRPVAIDKAARHLHHYSELMPARPDSASVLARYLRGMPPDESRAELVRLEKLWPMWSKLAVAAAINEPDPAVSETLALHALEMNPADAHALFLVGLLRWKAGRIDEARTAFADAYAAGFRISRDQLRAMPPWWAQGYSESDALRTAMEQLAPGNKPSAENSD